MVRCASRQAASGAADPGAGAASGSSAASIRARTSPARRSAPPHLRGRRCRREGRRRRRPCGGAGALRRGSGRGAGEAQGREQGISAASRPPQSNGPRPARPGTRPRRRTPAAPVVLGSTSRASSTISRRRRSGAGRRRSRRWGAAPGRRARTYGVGARGPTWTSSRANEGNPEGNRRRLRMAERAKQATRPRSRRRSARRVGLAKGIRRRTTASVPGRAVVGGSRVIGVLRSVAPPASSSPFCAKCAGRRGVVLSGAAEDEREQQAQDGQEDEDGDEEPETARTLDAEEAGPARGLERLRPVRAARRRPS